MYCEIMIVKRNDMCLSASFVELVSDGLLDIFKKKLLLIVLLFSVHSKKSRLLRAHDSSQGCYDIYKVEMHFMSKMNKTHDLTS